MINQYITNPVFWLNYFRLNLTNLLVNQATNNADFLKKYDLVNSKEGHTIPSSIEDLYKKDKQGKDNYIHVRLEGFSWKINFCGIGERLDFSWYVLQYDLGYNDIDTHLFALRWAELQAIIKYSKIALLWKVRQYSMRSGVDVKYLPLLFLKFTSYETIDKATYKAFLQQALEQIEVFPTDEIPFLVDWITTVWFSQHGESTYKWWEDDKLGWINNYPNSYRNPAKSALKDKGFQQLKRCFFAIQRATIIRAYQSKNHQCKGKLGATHYPFLETEAGKVHRSACCNQLICLGCYYPIKTWDNYSFYAPTQEERKQLYYCTSPSELPFIKKAVFGTPRLYSCLCWTDTFHSFDQIGYYEGIASWECGGHKELINN